MSDIPDTARRLLEALVDIESQAIRVAKANGCFCDDLVPNNPGRTYPIAVFDREANLGKPFNQIIWTMHHQDGCPMHGQKGVGLTTYGGFTTENRSSLQITDREDKSPGDGS